MDPLAGTSQRTSTIVQSKGLRANNDVHSGVTRAARTRTHAQKILKGTPEGTVPVS